MNILINWFWELNNGTWVEWDCDLNDLIRFDWLMWSDQIDPIRLICFDQIDWFNWFDVIWSILIWLIILELIDWTDWFDLIDLIWMIWSDWMHKEPWFDTYDLFLVDSIWSDWFYLIDSIDRSSGICRQSWPNWRWSRRPSTRFHYLSIPSSICLCIPLSAYLPISKSWRRASARRRRRANHRIVRSSNHRITMVCQSNEIAIVKNCPGPEIICSLGRHLTQWENAKNF